jgi:Fe(3+) dicitrate transport protein
MMRYFASVLFLATGFLAGQGPMAELVLTVVAPDGSPVESEGELIGPGAAVRRWVAGANGVSRVPEVTMGRYRVIVTAKGFAPGHAEVTVSGPGRLEQRIALELAPIQNSVVVRTLPQNLDGVPGSTAEVTTEELAALRPVSIKEAIRRMAGFHIVDEDAMGLNLNIGLRGLNPRRSQRTMLLEDGAPIHLAPYGDPSGHYHTPPELVEGIEAIKGSGQVLHGPQTVGGVINFLTAPPPDRLRVNAGAVVGSRDYRSFHGQMGTEIGRVGLLGTLLHRKTDGVRERHSHEVNLAALKSVVRLSTRQSLLLKGAWYEEDSRYSEGGMSEAAFAANPLGNPFNNDRFQLNRKAAQAVHTANLGEGVTLSTNFYYHGVVRTSYRQIDFPFDTMTAVAATGCVGAARTDYENFASRCGNKIRPRTYDVVGVEPRVSWRGTWMGMRSEGVAGFRVHQEWISRKRYNGFTPGAREDAPDAFFRDHNEIRVRALPMFLQNTFSAKSWTFTPGLRMENIRLRNRGLRRDNVAIDVTVGDSQRVWLPGFGMTYGGLSRAVFFAGVHAGFAPPRPDDNFDPTAPRFQPVSAERSVNTEAGVRTAVSRAVRIDATFFRLDFRNQIVPGVSVGQPLLTWANAGKTLNQGVEVSGRIEFDSLLPAGHSLFANVAYTRVITAEFNSDQIAGGRNVRGNRLPYAPGHLFHPAVIYRHRVGWNASVSLDSLGRQFVDNLNSTTTVASGMAGVVPGYTTLQMSVNVPLGKSGLALFVSGANVADRRFIVSRVDGIHVGRPRQALVGIRFGR